MKTKFLNMVNIVYNEIKKWPYIQPKIICYIITIIVFIILIYLNPIIIIETLAEQDNQDIEQLKKEVEDLKTNLKATNSLIKVITIGLVLVMAVSVYNWEAMYLLKEILKRK